MGWWPIEQGKGRDPVCTSSTNRTLSLAFRSRSRGKQSKAKRGVVKSSIMDALNAKPSKFILGKSVQKCWCSIKCLALTTHGLFLGVCHAAKAGKLLPCLTLMLPFQAVAHWFLFVTASITIPKELYWRRISLCILVANMFCCTAGYIILILLYRHSVQTVFNRNIPRLRRDDDGIIVPIAHPAVQSFNTHLLLLRPLEILFRFITAPLRVLPDLIVLGETRCGTTNLCGTIVSLSAMSSLAGDRMKVKCYTPFCAWSVPELDHKETFFFVGHYLGKVNVSVNHPLSARSV